MQGDPFIRLVLLIMAICLLVLVAQGFGLGAAPDAEAADPESPGRYTMTMLRGRAGPALLRIDTATGQAWRLQVNQGGEWELLGEGGTPETPVPAEPEPEEAGDPEEAVEPEPAP